MEDEVEQPMRWDAIKFATRKRMTLVGTTFFVAGVRGYSIASFHLTLKFKRFERSTGPCLSWGCMASRTAHNVV